MKTWFRILRIRFAGKRALLAKIHYKLALDGVIKFVNMRAGQLGRSPQEFDEVINSTQRMLFEDMIKYVKR